MSELRKTSRDINLSVIKYLSDHGLTSDAQATSTSGRYRIILAAHYREGLPCFDVLAFRITDGRVTRLEWWAKGEKNEKEEESKSSSPEEVSYDTSIEHAKTESRRAYEVLVAAMQEKGQPEESEEDKGLRIISPDGTTSDYKIN